MEYVPKFLHYLGNGKLQINIRILICQVLIVISIETRDRLKKRKKQQDYTFKLKYISDYIKYNQVNSSIKRQKSSNYIKTYATYKRHT